MLLPVLHLNLVCCSENLVCLPAFFQILDWVVPDFPSSGQGPVSLFLNPKVKPPGTGKVRKTLWLLGSSVNVTRSSMNIQVRNTLALVISRGYVFQEYVLIQVFSLMLNLLSGDFSLPILSSASLYFSAFVLFPHPFPPQMSFSFPS